MLSKAAAPGLVALLLSIALARISYLVDERAARQAEAVRSVQQSHAGAQTLLGPLLYRQCTEEWDVVSGTGRERTTSVERRNTAFTATPTAVSVDSSLHNDPRYRGLFKVNGYAGHFAIDADWVAAQPLRPNREHAGSRLQCQPVRLLLALGDVRGVRQALVKLGDARAATTAEVRAGTQHPVYGQGFHVELPASAWALDAKGEDAPLHARIELDLVGTAALAVVPAADSLGWKLRSDWPHPSFGGQYLPTARNVGEDSFDAQWQLSSLATSAPGDVVKGHPLCPLSPSPTGDESGYDPRMHPASDKGACLDTLAVSFIDPINPYVLSDRATKYGLLFIALTFIAVALAEVMGRGRVKRVHPVQYALVGLALTLFFLLLLSLSEHIAFGLAYGVASAACVLLLGVYTAHMLGRRRDGVLFGGALGVVYGLLYVLLQREQTALVIGSVGLFAAVAAVMWLTRRVDWYRMVDEARAPVAAVPATPGA
ncbi:MAG: cell envelope integrity protein CreD [Vitreoscilla sp.]|nr:cell envelope integrity protein CreD [Vitreoscilla sp.]MBP6674451.1 cell envelope integrity protein CreD [Vitreoscilla sp.]